MGQARTALLTVKRAWSSGNADACRHVCTDDYWRQLTSIFETYRGDGRRKVIDQLIVAQQQLQAIAIGDGRDRLTVRFTLSGHDYDVDVASDAIVSGFREVGQWIEDWTMQRDRAAGTLTTGRLETCPYCGAPAEVGDNGKCVHCGILMPGPTWDWLVAAVDRPVLPSGSPGDEQARVAGLAIAAQAVAGQAVADSGAPTIAPLRAACFITPPLARPQLRHLQLPAPRAPAFGAAGTGPRRTQPRPGARLHQR